MLPAYLGYSLLFTSMFLFFVVMGWGLPGLLLRTHYRQIKLNARGMRRCLFNGKRCVVYERGINQRRHISRYLLCQEDGYKVLQCKVSPNVRYLEYDVMLYDRYDNTVDVINVKEDVVSQYTRRLQLPDETAYVNVVLRKVNKSVLFKKRLAYIPRGRIAAFISLAFLLTLLESVVVMTSTAYAFGGVFREDYMSSPMRMLFGFGVCAAVGALAIGCIMLRLYRHRKA